MSQPSEVHSSVKALTNVVRPLSSLQELNKDLAMEIATRYRHALEAGYGSKNRFQVPIVIGTLTSVAIMEIVPRSWIWLRVVTLLIGCVVILGGGGKLVYEGTKVLETRNALKKDLGFGAFHKKMLASLDACKQHYGPSWEDLTPEEQVEHLASALLKKRDELVETTT